MNAQTTSTTQSQHLVPRVAEADSRLSRNHIGLLGKAGLAVLFILALPSTALAQAYLGVDLVPYAVLAGSTVTCAGAGSVTGDVGVSPGAAIIGFPSPCTDTGTLRIPPFADAGQADLLTAFGTLAGRVCDGGTIGPDLVGLTLTPGTYCVTAGITNLSGLLQLNAQGNPAATWVFIATTTLITSVGSTVAIINGGGTAQACGVQWLVQSSATINSGTTFLGNILALTDITLNGNLTGRALARNGQVTMTGGAASFAACGAAGGIGGVPPPFSVFGAPPPPITIALPPGTVGVPYTQPITPPSGGTAPITFTVVGGTLPPGLTLTPGGELSGTPTTPGCVTVTIRATDVNGIITDTTFTICIVSGAIPTLSEWAMIMLAALLAIAGFAAMRRRAR